MPEITCEQQPVHTFGLRADLGALGSERQERAQFYRMLHVEQTVLMRQKPTLKAEKIPPSGFRLLRQMPLFRVAVYEPEGQSVRHS